MRRYKDRCETRHASHDHTAGRPRYPTEYRLFYVLAWQVGKKPGGAHDDAGERAKDYGGEDIDEGDNRDLYGRGKVDALVFGGEGDHNQDGNRNWLPNAVARQDKAADDSKRSSDEEPHPKGK